MNEEMVKMVNMTDADQIVGKIVVLWKNEQKLPSRIVSVDKDKQEINYEVLVGPEKGKKGHSRYDHRQKINVYEEGANILAMLNT